MDIHLNLHVDPAFEQRLDSLLKLLVQQQENVMAAIDDLTADVTTNTSVVQSAVALLSNLTTQLNAAVASGDMTQVAALATTLSTNNAALAVAVAANTPAAPSSPPASP